MVAVAPRFPRFIRWEKRIFGRPIKIDRRPGKPKSSGKSSGGLTGQIPLFNITVAGPLAQCSGGDRGIKNPVNGYERGQIRHI